MKSLFLLQPLLLPALWLTAEPALAGPGGIIAKALWHSNWGKAALVLMALIFLPLIVMSLLEERLAERRSRKDLSYMAGHSALFDWLALRERIRDCFCQVHSQWSQDDLTRARAWMTEWYLRNQQMGFLDRWQRQGLVNHCEIRRIGRIRPLMFAHRNVGAAHQQSLLVVSVSARMQDYLADRETGKVVEGRKGFREIETLWTLTLEGDNWRVSNIEEAGSVFDYTRMGRELPAIETTLSNRFRA